MQCPCTLDTWTWLDTLGQTDITHSIKPQKLDVSPAFAFRPTSPSLDCQKLQEASPPRWSWCQSTRNRRTQGPGPQTAPPDTRANRHTDARCGIAGELWSVFVVVRDKAPFLTSHIGLLTQRGVRSNRGRSAGVQPVHPGGVAPGPELAVRCGHVCEAMKRNPQCLSLLQNMRGGRFSVHDADRRTPGVSAPVTSMCGGEGSVRI